MVRLCYNFIEASSLFIVFVVFYCKKSIVTYFLLDIVLSRPKGIENISYLLLETRVQTKISFLSNVFSNIHTQWLIFLSITLACAQKIKCWTLFMHYSRHQAQIQYETELLVYVCIQTKSPHKSTIPVPPLCWITHYLPLKCGHSCPIDLF